MRSKFANVADTRATFTAVVVKHGIKIDWYGIKKTLLLSDIKTADNKTLASSLWINATKELEKLNP